MIAEVMSNMPEWLRRELLSSEKALRACAEETLAAMLTSALSASAAK
jgi:hypothetical protein